MHDNNIRSGWILSGTPHKTLLWIVDKKYRRVVDFKYIIYQKNSYSIIDKFDSTWRTKEDGY